MNNENNLTYHIEQIISILSSNQNLKFNHPNLPKFLADRITTPVSNMLPLLQRYKSSLFDKECDLKLLTKLIEELNKNNSVIRLSHIGFCYKILSSETEKKRLIGLVKQTKSHLYQEQSNDGNTWLFIGDANNWEDPAMEVVLVEKTNDPQADYWLPHIQIDIDTTLSGREIEKLIWSVFENSIKPFPIIIEGKTYIIRNHLGVVDGINIFLDLATNERNVKDLRQNGWKKII
jgi:hypothetical protein